MAEVKKVMKTWIPTGMDGYPYWDSFFTSVDTNKYDAETEEEAKEYFASLRELANTQFLVRPIFEWEIGEDNEYVKTHIRESEREEIWKLAAQIQKADEEEDLEDLLTFGKRFCELAGLDSLWKETLTEDTWGVLEEASHILGVSI